MAKGKLDVAVQTFVVQSLACFDSPGVVAEAVRKEFGQTIARQSVEAYDPNKKAGAKLAQRWRALFAESRKAFLDSTAEIGISHRTVRLRALQRMASGAEDRGNLVLAAQLLEQAAKEVGDVYTNKRQLSGSLALKRTELSDDELAAIATGSSD